jgi:hypothetical protein
MMTVLQKVLAALSLVGLALLCGCGSDDNAHCAQNPQNTFSEAPIITDFSLVETLKGDPWTLIFSLSFTDSNGDLGQLGKAEIFLNGNDTPERIELQEIFSQSAVESGATEGTLALPLRFGESLADGTQVNLGLQILDANSFRSNCFSLDLFFEVGAAP